MIPLILHYCYFGGKPWSLVHYACVKSAVERIKPERVLLHCDNEPSGPWWELTRPLVTVERLAAPTEIFGNRLFHPAHQADVVRLEALQKLGGIYLDIDVFVHRSFNPLLSNSVVLGEQKVDNTTGALCNAVLLAEPRAPFLAKWYSEYKSFRARGHDEHWDEHAVKVPYRLSKLYPGEITILPYTAFYWPTFLEADLDKIYVLPEPIDTSKAYATHLWESSAWSNYLDGLTPRRVRSVNSNFHSWVRPMISAIPDNYGMPKFSLRASAALRRTARRARSVLIGSGQR